MRPGFINSFQPSTISSAQPGDPLWDYVVLDMTMNGSTPTDFVDTSNYARPVTVVSRTPRLWSPICGDGALNLCAPQANNYLSTNSSMNLGSADFTIEAWVNFSRAPTGGTFPSIIAQRQNFTTQNSFSLGYNTPANEWYFQYSNNGSSTNSVFVASAIVVGQWYHVCAERSGSTLRLYVDGVIAGTTTIAGSIFTSAQPTRIGAFDNPAFSGSYFPGFISSLRVTAAARYNGAFTPSCPVSGGSDPLWASTLLYMPFNTTSGLTDISTFARPFTSTGFTTIATVRCGSKMLSLDALPSGGGFSGGGLQVPYPECRMALEAKDFTIEAFIQFYGTPTGFPQIVLQRFNDQADEAFLFWYDVPTSQLRFLFNRNGAADRTIYGVNFVPVVGTWYHVAVSRSGGTLLMFIDGVQVLSSPITGSMFDSTQRVTIGTGGPGDNAPLDFGGAIDGLRIYKGVAKYTSNFTPSCPLPAPTPTAGVIDLVASTGYGQITFADFVDSGRTWRAMGLRHYSSSAARPFSVRQGLNDASATRKLLRVAALGYGGAQASSGGGVAGGGGGGGRVTGVGNDSTLAGVTTGSSLLAQKVVSDFVFTTAAAAVTVQAGGGGQGGNASVASTAGGDSLVSPVGALNAAASEVARGAGGGGQGQGGLGVRLGGTGATANGGSGGTGSGNGGGGGGGIVGNGAPGNTPALSNNGGNGGAGLALPALEQAAVVALTLQDSTWVRMTSPMGGGGGGGGGASPQGVGPDGGGRGGNGAINNATRESSGTGGNLGGARGTPGSAVLLLCWPLTP